MSQAAVAITEEWKRVDGHSYWVSSLGRVKRDGGEPIKPRVHTHGYLRASLCDEGKQTDAYIHRLVCSAFHGAPPLATYHAHHINGARSDNRAANLEWLSPQDNRKLRKLARGEQHSAAKINDGIARSILTRSIAGEGDRSIAKSVGISREQVRDIRRRRAWKHVSA